MVEVSMADEDRFRSEVDEVLDHERRAAGRHLKAGHEGIEQNHVPLDRGRKRGVGDP